MLREKLHPKIVGRASIVLVPKHLESDVHGFGTQGAVRKLPSVSVENPERSSAVACGECIARLVEGGDFRLDRTRGRSRGPFRPDWPGGGRAGRMRPLFGSGPFERSETRPGRIDRR